MTANALSCNDVNDYGKTTCEEIMNSTLPLQDQQHLVANILYPSFDQANHSFIYDWNSNMSFNETIPNGIIPASNGYIKNAWLKIFSVPPSVLESNKTLSAGYGKIQIAYNYTIVIPSGTEEEDCRTEYFLDSKSDALNTYLNNGLLGTSTTLDFEGTGTLDFKSELNILVSTRVEHYATKRWCCLEADGSCQSYCEACRHSGTEIREHEVFLQDTKTTYSYLPNIVPIITPIDHYKNTSVLMLDISNFTIFRVYFDNSSFEQLNYFYDANLSMAPYDVLTLNANKFITQRTFNLYVEQSGNIYKFYVPDFKNCRLEFSDHFNTWERPCNLEFNFLNFSISTDKLIYDEDDVINVSIEPKNSPVKIEYGNVSLMAENNALLNTDASHNKIIAYFGERKTEKIIYVKNKDVWNSVFDLGVFSGVLYSVYIAMRKYWIFI